MLPKDQNSIDDRMLTQYLLGAVSEEDAERLDELSVTDDAVAARTKIPAKLRPRLFRLRNWQ